MKYTVEIEVERPVDKVVELFDDPGNLDKWMEGLQSFEHISGTPGQPGSKTIFHFHMGGREVEMIETISVKNLPQEFSASYEANGVINLSKTTFVELPGDRTKYVSEQEFKLKGFMKLMGWVMPGAFKKQTLKYLNNFKHFAENEN